MGNPSVSLSKNSGIRELKRVQRLVRYCLNALEAVLKQASKNTIPQNEQAGEGHWPDWLWGSKENAVYVLVKLAQLQIKLIEMQQQLSQREPASDKPILPLSDQEWALINRVVSRRQHATKQGDAS